MRDEKRDSPRVFCEGSSMTELKFALFPTHDDEIDDREIDKQNEGGNPGVRRDSRSERKYCAAQVQWIARVGVRTGYRQDFLLV